MRHRSNRRRCRRSVRTIEHCASVQRPMGGSLGPPGVKISGCQQNHQFRLFRRDRRVRRVGGVLNHGVLARAVPTDHPRHPRVRAGLRRALSACTGRTALTTGRRFFFLRVFLLLRMAALGSLRSIRGLCGYEHTHTHTHTHTHNPVPSRPTQSRTSPPFATWCRSAPRAADPVWAGRQLIEILRLPTDTTLSTELGLQAVNLHP